jgi:hypothetical protein
MSKESKKDSHAKTGRIAFDDHGNAVWEWRTDTGTFTRDVDTFQVKALQDDAGIQLAEPSDPRGHDPYSTASYPTISKKKDPRRTPADMRKLSEEIERARADKKPRG